MTRDRPIMIKLYFSNNSKNNEIHYSNVLNIQTLDSGDYLTPSICLTKIIAVHIC